MRNVPPISPDQKVKSFVTSNEKSKARSLPAAPARASAWSGATGSCTRRVTITAITAKTMSPICFTSTQVTACTPPIMV